MSYQLIIVVHRQVFWLSQPLPAFPSRYYRDSGVLPAKALIPTIWAESRLQRRDRSWI